MLYLNLKVLGKYTLWFSNYAFLLKENSEEYKKRLTYKSHYHRIIYSNKNLEVNQFNNKDVVK